jgi:hypothetical protein
MKHTHTRTRHLLTLLTAALLTTAAHAQLSIPSDGSDGAFNPAANVEIDLGLATTALWNTPGSGNGVYDADKWAVVFKYSSVNIPAGVKVTFKNHPTYAPVVWLVQGNVTIAGELNLDGKPGKSYVVGSLIPTEPGPGGFRGGAVGPSGRSYGYGPGGSGPSDNGFGNNGQYLNVYGNPQIVPLIGGSGSASKGSPQAGSGAGGAIAIFAAQSALIEGTISAKGGNTNNPDDNNTGFASMGSGGAVKVVALTVSGSGSISCQRDAATAGRIRIETSNLAPTLRSFPETIGVPPANPPIIWPAANAPTARVVSVDAVNAPVDPRAPLVAGADVAIQNSNQVAILIETQNFPIEGAVQLNITPKFGARTTLNATRLSGDITSATWRVQTTLPQGFVTLQARATQP